MVHHSHRHPLRRPRGLLAMLLLALLSQCRPAAGPATFYVDPAKGSDSNGGSMDRPFRSLDKALAVVGDRVERGLLSDKIYLRAGVYRKASPRTLYHLRLKGRPGDYACLSAMPAAPHAPGAVQRKSGRWYEQVVFDDAQVIGTPWTPVPGHAGVWATHPGYTQLEWTQQNLWPWRRTAAGFPLSDKDSTPASTLFTVAPYMLLQDGEPTVWADSLGALSHAGQHSYDQRTGTLYVYPFAGRDPNGSRMETWYGGPEQYEEGMLYLDGEGRGLFNGDMEYARITGCAFRMFLRMFEYQRRGYQRAPDREIQRHLTIEDNLFAYGWIQFLLDGNTIYTPDDSAHVYPRFADRAYWTLRNNVFYRPSREVFQVYGAHHLFAENAVIDHNGPWAGPAACVGLLNARNMDSLVVRDNYIVGQGNNPYHPGSIFMMEVGGRHSVHSRQGDYIYKGPTYTGNLIAQVSAGPAFVLGKGDIRMRDITISDNIISVNGGGPAIRLSSPQKNLRISHNIFYRQQQAIEVFGKGAPLMKPPLPSSMLIDSNMFVGNRSTFDPRLRQLPEGSVLTITHNLFSGNGDPPAGDGPLSFPVTFRDPQRFDFRVAEPYTHQVEEEGVGPRSTGSGAPPPARWSLLEERMKKALPLRGQEGKP